MTRRQTEIAELVARGLTNKQIARRTGLSVSTVETHIRDAAERIPGEGRPRHRLTLWFLRGEDG